MKQLKLTYSPYTLRLKSPFVTSSASITERNGFLIIMENENGVTGNGDAAPLPEFGSETYEEAEDFLSNFNLQFRIDLENPANNSFEHYEELKRLPAVRHGLEQALLTLICNERNITFNSIAGRKSRPYINVNAAIGFMDAQAAADRATGLVSEGYRTLKIKAGRRDFQQDLDVIKAVRNSVEDNINIRIDVNGKWDLPSAVKNMAMLEQFNPEYIEQPVNTLADFMALKKETAIPLAPDESIRTAADAQQFIESGSINFIILKPMMCGGLFPSLKIITAAESAGIKTVVTSSLESSVGKAMAVFIASLLGHDTAHGLSTSDWFENDIIRDPFPVKSGRIHLA